ncbi:MAG: hypothetical protein IPL99_03735 [Candidatus Competibacteraceae bacterium]|nr:hypothetical protein [Candidatus Competibacteraceae bacterium]
MARAKSPLAVSEAALAVAHGRISELASARRSTGVQRGGKIIPDMLV